MLLLFVIYMAFISLGLPDAVLGAAWPVMSHDLHAPLEFAGVISLFISVGTVVSSLGVTKMMRHFGVGKVVAFSVLLTAGALLGFSMANVTLALILLAVPLGLGAGSVDAALNNFVAVHYKAKHMNYLHSFWGVGATTGPLIIANYLFLKEGWRDGYAMIAYVQFSLVIVLFAALPLWRKAVLIPSEHQQEKEQKEGQAEGQERPLVTNMSALKIQGVSLQLAMFFCYCAIEIGTGLWAASFLTVVKNTPPVDAAFWVAMFYLGITAGRFACGAVSDNIAAETLVRYGSAIILLGCVLLALPFSAIWAKIGLVCIGLGCAPIFPNTLHLTPKRFGIDASQAIIGMSMATAYIGIMVVPLLLGAIAQAVSFAVLPFILLVFGVGTFVTTERLKRYRKAT